jgi:ketosteroid isomerase-like protein
MDVIVGVTEPARTDFSDGPGSKSGDSERPPHAAMIACMLDTSSSASSSPDLETLRQLNGEYIQAVIRSDVNRFSELLASDFLCSRPDGTLIDRSEFLKHTAEPYPFLHLEAHDVTVRLLGDVAIVHARTTFVHPDGARGAGRYTDVWARRGGRWLAVAAHFTRV